jgi:hypothetical protein
MEKRISAGSVARASGQVSGIEIGEFKEHEQATA